MNVEINATPTLTASTNNTCLIPGDNNVNIRLYSFTNEVFISLEIINVNIIANENAIIAIITVTIAIPAIYWIINASLEATINNYRSSQSMFQTLYKERGKIKTNSK